MASQGPAFGATGVVSSRATSMLGNTGMMLFLSYLATKSADAAPTSGKLLATWQTLMSEGCDMEKSHVNTPLEARILSG
jgi:hypothetical protein